MLFGRTRKRRIENVLIVEDEPLIAFDNEHFLGDAGFNIVATVDSVAHAMAAIDASGEIDLLLVDVNLADGSGVDVAQVAHARGIPVLFATGNFPDEARPIAAGCLAKPYPQRDLVTAIETIEAVIDGGKVPRRLPASFSLFARAA
jgi:DNA-binding response OmpR family regulator